MANVPITSGTGTNIATNSVTRDAVTEQMQLVNVGDPTSAVAAKVTGAGQLAVTQTSQFLASVPLAALSAVAGPSNVSGVGDWGLQLTTTNFIGTVSFQASIDGTNYVNVNARQVGQGATVDNLFNSWAATGTTTSVVFRGNSAPFQFLQFIVTAFTSGTVNAFVALGGNTGGIFPLASIPTGSATIGSVGVTAIGGAFVALPAGSVNGTLVPSGPTGTEFTCVGGGTPGSVTYTIAAAQPGAAPTLLRQTVAGAAGTSSVIDQVNLAIGTNCYVTASAGIVFYRAV